MGYGFWPKWVKNILWIQLAKTCAIHFCGNFNNLEKMHTSEHFYPVKQQLLPAGSIRRVCSFFSSNSLIFCFLRFSSMCWSSRCNLSSSFTFIVLSLFFLSQTIQFCYCVDRFMQVTMSISVCKMSCYLEICFKLSNLKNALFRDANTTIQNFKTNSNPLILYQYGNSHVANSHIHNSSI